MQLIRSLHNLRPQHRGCAVTIGNFDGVHRGHKAVMRQLLGHAERLGVPSMAISFEPLPRELFARGAPLPRLSSLREKWTAMREIGLDYLLLLYFGQDIAGMSAATFIERVLVEALAIRFLVVGDDFRFGRDRCGDFALLKDAGTAHHFQVEATDTFYLGGERISSTRVRAALAEGEMERAEQLLGHPFRISGRVRHGDKRGRTIGFPTANLALKRCATPVGGVFAVTLEGAQLRSHPGVANVGRRPTVNGERPQLEVHLLDFSGDLYGAHLDVDFRHKIRGEQRFPDLAALTAQIGRDVEATRRLLIREN